MYSFTIGETASNVHFRVISISQKKPQMLGISTFNRTQHLFKIFEESPIIIGSGNADGTEQMGRVIVNDQLVQADHCELHWERVGGKLLVVLRVNGHSVALDSGPRIHPGVVVDLDLPETFWMGDTLIQLDDLAARHDEHDKHLIVKPIANRRSLALTEMDHSPSPATLASWFEALGMIQRSSANTNKYFNDVSRACFCPGGMDGAMVIESTQGEWKILGSHIRYPEFGIGFRPELVNHVIKQNVVIFHNAQASTSIANAQHSIIICPIVKPDQTCTSVLYCFRSQHRRNNRIGIRPLETCFIELIAQNVSTALARIESDARAAETRVLLEQAFSPQVAQTLQQDPTILEGQNREITALFCDLRNFSTISERVGPKTTYELLTDVMDYFCEIISKHNGVIIDFYGDGVSAFWNAPLDTPNHPQIACQCAMEIAAIMPVLEHKWAAKLGSQLRVGIGVHTGMAQVGNSGSKTRLKYGPQGNSVNLTARLESATKHLGTTILISEATRRRLPEEYCLRRVCNTQLSGMKQAVSIYELLDDKIVSERKTQIARYEAALELFESRSFENAFDALSSLTLDYDNDRVTEFLLAHCSKIISGELNATNRPSTKEVIYPLMREPRSGHTPSVESVALPNVLRNAKG